MPKNLVIVESPAKAKTIERFLGSDFIVKSCYGHIRDLKEKDMSVDVENNFAPTYEVPSDKKKILDELKKLAKKAELVWLATDEDREGEAISWHLSEALKLDEAKTKRIVFHEITKSAILNAIENPRTIDKKLVDAQQARRVLDRLVGFEVSPILWKKVKPALSAGRVQSVAVRLIVEREREIQNFNVTSGYKVVAQFYNAEKGKEETLFKAEIPKKFSAKEEAVAFLQKLKAASFTVKSVEKKPATRSPAAPFTTSTLQQEASRKLGFSVLQTMRVAQNLYEAGKITYMRTDSVNLSNMAIGAAKDEVINRYGSQYANPRNHVTKAKGAQEAHEAIRPTYLNNDAAQVVDDRENKLYDLIWKRTIASQMANAELEKTLVNISVSTATEEFIATGEVIKFDGFLKVYMESIEEDEDENKGGILPPLSEDAVLLNNEINATQKFSKPPYRFSEAQLVRKMEQLGIGRPSTYAPTISTIQKREYVEKRNVEAQERDIEIVLLASGSISERKEKEKFGFEKGKLAPTDIGLIVNDFLVEHFPDVLDYGFTASVEEEFDAISRGEKPWNEMIKNFYSPFHKKVEITKETSEKAKGERLLGVDPATGKNIYVKIGKYGPIAQIGEVEDEEKPRFAGLMKGQSLNDITLEQALDLFKLPRSLGEYEGDEIIIGVGRYGPYAKYKEKFFSLKKEDDPMSITKEKTIELIKEKTPKPLGEYEGKEMTTGIGRYGPFVKHNDKYYSVPRGEELASVTKERAIEIIEQKRSADKKKEIKTFPENDKVKVLNGKYGPYILIGKKNHKIPKDKKPEELTLEECLKIGGASKK
ncbi:type I DNA topoisomerase [Bacteroidales bacterium AH-315-I05]|nr:type I DNA topoisomerase [Bacteroidales bacterium AH-315-I05]